jgi:hypothetical protein
MSTRRGWQATGGELEAVLRHLDVAQDADAQVRDGQMWICHHPEQPWVAAVRIPTALAARARRWVAPTSLRPSRAPLLRQSLPHRAGTVGIPAVPTPTHASGTRRSDRPLYGNPRSMNRLTTLAAGPVCRTTHGKNLCPPGSSAAGFSTPNALLASLPSSHFPPVPPGFT